MNKELKKQRIFWLDLARTFAVISISLNHAVNRSYHIHVDQMSEFLSIPLASTLFKTVIYVFSRIGVPLFLMISGSLLLRKKITDEEGIKKFYRTNYLDLLITSEIWFFLMYCILSKGLLFSQGAFNVSAVPGFLCGLVKTMLFIDQVTFGNMWYLPMILCVYLMIPIFALVFRNVSPRVIALPCAIVFLSQMIITDINDLLRIGGSEKKFVFALDYKNIFSVYLLYVLIGYWISIGGLKRLRKELVACFAGAAFIVCCIFQLYAFSRPNNYLVAYDCSFILITSMFLFEFIRRCKEPERIIKRCITYISKISFGIFFVHILIMTFLTRFSVLKDLPRPVYLIVLETISVGGSIVLIWLLSHIYICRRRLFLIKD